MFNLLVVNQVKQAIILFTFPILTGTLLSPADWDCFIWGYFLAITHPPDLPQYAGENRRYGHAHAAGASQGAASPFQMGISCLCYYEYTHNIRGNKNC